MLFASNISSPQRGISKQLWSSGAVAVPGTQQQSAIVVRKEHHRAYLQAAASATNSVVNAFVCRACVRARSRSCQVQSVFFHQNLHADAFKKK
jgi:hypothetical protein